MSKPEGQHADHRTIVLDDDPTGTQSAADVSMVLGPDFGTLTDVLRRLPLSTY